MEVAHIDQENQLTRKSDSQYVQRNPRQAVILCINLTYTQALFLRAIEEAVDKSLFARSRSKNTSWKLKQVTANGNYQKTSSSKTWGRCKACSKEAASPALLTQCP